jgi:hypothetical protein
MLGPFVALAVYCIPPAKSNAVQFDRANLDGSLVYRRIVRNADLMDSLNPPPDRKKTNRFLFDFIENHSLTTLAY